MIHVVMHITPALKSQDAPIRVRLMLKTFSGWIEGKTFTRILLCGHKIRIFLKADVITIILTELSFK